VSIPAAGAAAMAAGPRYDYNHRRPKGTLTAGVPGTSGALIPSPRLASPPENTAEEAPALADNAWTLLVSGT